MNVTLRAQPCNIDRATLNRASKRYLCLWNSMSRRVSLMNVWIKMSLLCLVIASPCVTFGSSPAMSQERPTGELGPVVSAYLGYLRNEQEVVDDRASRKEISRAYYRRNSNRIRALREIAIRIARESKNDYLPELEAVAGDEFGTLFEHPPNVAGLRVGEVINFTLRYLGFVRFGENYYLFARLDPYEQAELREKHALVVDRQESPAKSLNPNERKTRPRRVHSPR